MLYSIAQIKLLWHFFTTDNIQYCGSLFFDKIDEPHPITQHPTSLSAAYAVGMNLIKEIK